MSELLFESPIAIVVLGGLLTSIAVVTWIYGGFRAALYSAIALALLTLLLVMLSINIRTDREQITAVMNDVAAAVERNDLDGVLEHVHSKASSGIRHARTELPSYQFTEARITGIKNIEVDSRTNPPSALAEFFVSVSIRGGGNEANGIRRFVRAYFFRENGRWLVHDYEHFDIGQSMRGPANTAELR